MLYSVVIPCYRSDQTIEHVVDQTREEMVRLGRANVEFVLVNDCSPDGGKTIQVLRKMAAEHRDVKVIDLARNSGQHNALMAALRHADGDVIIGMDDDGQTHPSQLGKLFETNMRRSLILSSGNPFVFVTRSISCAILILAVFMLFFPILSNMVAEKRMKSKK